MAAEWHYVANGQQAGPVELQTLRQMLASGSISALTLVYGPGLTQWTSAGQTPVLTDAGPAASASSPAADAGPAASASSPAYAGPGAGPAASASGPAYAGPVVGVGAMLAYRGVETETTGLSPAAIEALRQTKPWVRFIAIMTFIFAGFLVLGGAGMLCVSLIPTARTGLPPWLAGIYFAMAILYIIPGVLLSRYANGIASLMQTRRNSDLENALTAQKSFWKFAGVALIILLCLYFVFGAVMIITKGRF